MHRLDVARGRRVAALREVERALRRHDRPAGQTGVAGERRAGPGRRKEHQVQRRLLDGQRARPSASGRQARRSGRRRCGPAGRTRDWRAGTAGAAGGPRRPRATRRRGRRPVVASGHPIGGTVWVVPSRLSGPERWPRPNSRSSGSSASETVVGTVRLAVVAGPARPGERRHAGLVASAGGSEASRTTALPRRVEDRQAERVQRDLDRQILGVGAVAAVALAGDAQRALAGGHAERRWRHLVLVEQAGVLQDRRRRPGAGRPRSPAPRPQARRGPRRHPGGRRPGSRRCRSGRLADPFELQDDGAVLLAPAGRPARDEALDGGSSRKGEHGLSVGETGRLRATIDPTELVAPADTRRTEGCSHVQSNPMKAALKEGKVQIGIWLNLMRNPAILTLMKSAGMDYARIDMEHSSPSIETVADMAVLGPGARLPGRGAPAGGEPRVDHPPAGLRRLGHPRPPGRQPGGGRGPWSRRRATGRSARAGRPASRRARTSTASGGTRGRPRPPQRAGPRHGDVRVGRGVPPRRRDRRDGGDRRGDARAVRPGAGAERGRARRTRRR